ncbi:bifunctional transcriptional activator/DNA repair enzyme AdaA [Sulfitobacter sp. F26169L]|uniref:bifunctional transcriptional activator/DNA repair enzyme AdaA n=1 Tax=Sulfitobacter sp. F26169L TaxID=2996015 RepID=UPI002B202069|nr:bifunctional transcriptional activator/DNA repair enzyme AdaA [Sulfitobacter sp. F26169L]
MMFELPDDEVLYAALLARDAAWDGRAWVGVSSTGVFCRLTCPARKPKAENCTFFDSIGRAIEGGYRACTRCHPMAPAAEGEPAVKALLAALEADPARRWAEGDIAALGFDLSTVRRAFKRHFGMTFLEILRLARLRAGAAEMAGGSRVIEAQLEAGYSSASAFRAAFAGWTGLPPGAFCKNALLRADWIETPLGAMVAVSSDSALHLLDFSERRALPAELLALRRDAKGSLGFGRFAPTDRIEREMAA